MTQINLQKLANIYSQLQSLSSTGATNSKDLSNLNSIFALVGMQNSTNNAELNGKSINYIIKIAKEILSAFLTNNEKSEATEEVNKNKKDAKDIDNKITSTTENFQKEVDLIIQNIDMNIEIINTALENIEEKKEVIEDAKEKLEDKKKEIEEQKEQLTKTTDRDQQLTILWNIKKLAAEIPGILSSIEEFQDELAKHTENVTNASDAIEVLKGNSTEVQANAQNEIAEITSDNAQEIKDNTGSVGTALGENIPTATVATTAATAAAATGVGAEAAKELTEVANDHTGASGARLTGGTENIALNIADINKLASVQTELAGLITDINSKISNFSNLIGSWNSTVEPLITSIGSINKINESAEELASFVNEDIDNISKNTNDEETSQTDKNNNYNENNNNKDNVNNNQFKTLEFKTSKLSFGV